MMYGIHRYVNYINVLIRLSHNITVLSEGPFIRDLCLIRDGYTVFNNCANTNKSWSFYFTICVPLRLPHVCLRLVFCRFFFYTFVVIVLFV